MTITGTERLDQPVDVIVLSCKAYGLAGALEAIAPYVGKGTPILPLLNGLNHIEVAQQHFPEAVVCGGTAGISAILTPEGIVRHLNANQTITAGLLPGQTGPDELLEELISEMQRAGINAVLSNDVRQMMWDKWTFLATLAASTCLMRGTIAEILATDHGESLMAALYDECNRTATAEGHPPNSNPVQDYRGTLFDRTAHVTASMARDMEGGGPTEADHIIGDMIRRAEGHGIQTPYLKAAHSMLQIYEGRRAASSG